MKKYMLGALLSCCAFSVSAFPMVDFSFDGGSIEVVSGSVLGLGGYSANSGGAMLGVGDTENFTFGTAGLLGGGSGQVKIGVDFTSPISEEIKKKRDFSVWSLGIISGGTLQGGSKTFNYFYGDYAGVAKLKFDGFNIPIQKGAHFDITGSIKNVSMVRVPEPTTIVLLGLGLLAVGFTRRKHAD